MSMPLGVPLALLCGGLFGALLWVLPAGKLLVMGDHRGNSFDGRFFGLVDADTVYGKAVAVYWRRGEGPEWRRL